MAWKMCKFDSSLYFIHLIKSCIVEILCLSHVLIVFIKVLSEKCSNTFRNSTLTKHFNICWSKRSVTRLAK